MTSVELRSRRKGNMEFSDDETEFQKGYSKCCNDIVEIMDNVPEDASKEYIIHYLFSELCAKFYLMKNPDDTA